MTIYNFSAGPAMLPEEVKQRIELDLYNWNETGCSVMEISHRSSEFIAMAEENEQLLRSLLNINDTHAVMLIPGGARLQYSMLPLNLSSTSGKALYHINGHWGKEALKEAKRFCQAQSLQQQAGKRFNSIVPVSSDIDPASDYMHYTSNETLEGIQWHHIPESNGVKLCCDMTSDILTRPVDVSRYSVIYASAQKNLGIAGITCVIMRLSDIGHSTNKLPTMLNYQTFAETQSFYNTPPVFPWYVMLLTLRWVSAQGGVESMQEKNRQKSRLLYNYIDSSDFYCNKIEVSSRSEINVPFWLNDETLNDKFLQLSAEQGLKGLKGHFVVGGMRASLYNAMPLTGIESLIEFMKEFERSHG